MANRFLSNIRINDAYTFPASDGNNGQFIATDGAGNLTFTDPSASSSASIIYRDNFTGDGTTTVFTLQNSLSDEDQTQIYIDGVYQEKSTYSLSTNAITFSTAPINGHSIEVISISGINVGPTTIYQDNFTGDGTTTDFTLAQAIDNEVKTMIYFNGVYQFKDTYTLNSTTISFDTAPANGVDIEVISIASAAAADYNQLVKFYGKATEAISKGDAVMLGGQQGDHFLLSKATQAAISSNHEYFLGLASQDLTTGEFGYVTEFGKINELDTSGYTAGDILWFDAGGSTAGALTTTEPAAPLAKIQVAAVIRSHQNEGVLFVRPTWYHELGELHDVNITSIADKDLLVWNNSNSYWENTKTLGDLTLTGNLTVNGTQTILNTQTVEVEDNILQLNTTQGSPDTATATTSGISVYRGDGVTQASFIFDDADDTWDLTNNLVVAGNVTASAFLMSNGSLTNNSFWGTTLNAGSGSFADFALLDSSTTRIMHVPTGTRNVVFESSVGIGTTSPSTKLHLGGTAPLDSIIRQDSTVSGTNWEIGERAAGKWQIWEDDGDSVVATFMSTGNVGIGTTSPTMGLHIADTKGALFGSATVASTYISPTDENTINGGYGLDTDTADVWLNYRGYQDGFTRFRDTRIGNGKGSAIVMVDGSAGHVGIGTTSPLNQLHIASPGTPVINLERVDDLLGEGNVIGALRFTSESPNTIISQIYAQSDQNYTTKGRLVFQTNDGSSSVERMRIDSSGLVRIQKNTASTTEPLLKLSNASGSTTDGVKMIFEVANTSGNGGEIAVVRDGGSFNPYMTFNVSSGVASAPIERMRINSVGDMIIKDYGNIYASTNNSTVNSGIYFGGTDNTLRFYTSNDEKMRITSGGYTEIKATGGSSRLYLEGTSGTHFLTGTSGGDFGIYNDTASSYRMFINSSGNVGIGTTSPGGKLEVNAQGGGVGGYTGIKMKYGTSSVQSLYMGQVTAGNGAFIGTAQYRNAGYWQSEGTASSVINMDSAGNMGFYTNSGLTANTDFNISERMRITSAGYLKASNTGSYSSATSSEYELINSSNGNQIGKLTHSGTVPYGIQIQYSAVSPNTTDNYFLLCSDNAPANRLIIWGNGNVVNSNNSYGSISDSRLKENIVDATPKLDELMKVKVRNFNLKGEETKQIGVVAQELEEVFPGMISESKDPDSDDETLYKSVKYSVFVPIMIKAMQEQQDVINDLKAEIETLKLQING